MRAVNVEGTRLLLDRAARGAPARRRIVHTSSCATCGPVPGRAATEADAPPGRELRVPYKATKLAGERLALDAARTGLEVVVVNPTTPVGAGDRRPTPTGKMVADVVAGRARAHLRGGVLNVVAVEDVAVGHVRALERGRAGERYLLGGENMAMRDVFAHVAAAAGRPRAPRGGAVERCARGRGRGRRRGPGPPARAAPARPRRGPARAPADGLRRRPCPPRARAPLARRRLRARRRRPRGARRVSACAPVYPGGHGQPRPSDRPARGRGRARPGGAVVRRELRRAAEGADPPPTGRQAVADHDHGANALGPGAARDGHLPVPLRGTRPRDPVPEPARRPRSRCSKAGTCRHSPWPFRGTLRDGTFTWPARARGIPLTFRVVVAVRGRGRVNLDYAVRVRR